MLGYLVYQATLFLSYELALSLLPSPGATVQVPFLAPDARLLASTLLAAEASTPSGRSAGVQPLMVAAGCGDC